MGKAPRKKDGKLTWRGTKKDPQTYMIREKALEYLQISLDDFRNICILKGVYPADPKKRKNKKIDPGKTYYLSKDIKYLSHDNVIEKYRQLQVHSKKIKKIHST